MAVYRVQLAFPFDSTLPKDVVTINPHYFGVDPQQLGAALKANLIAWNPTTTAPWSIKVYNATDPPPQYPLATFSQTGSAPPSQMPREVALCLSYYSTYNRPRFRGRLYLPPSWFGGTANLRPTTAEMDAALGFGTNVLAKALPTGHNWVVYSQVEHKSQGGVTDMWVDDEWDTIRSRGLVATTRRTAKVA